MKCTVCGGTAFQRKRVLWDKLVSDWELSPEEADYIDRQQGEHCTQCRSNIRSIALANAIRNFLPTEKTLLEALRFPEVQDLSILEINEAGMLSRFLRQMRGHVFGAYPQVDLHAMPYLDNSFDLVVHSDTLEHVEKPVVALRECLRVLKPGGALCFTVPIVVGRMSRSRSGLPKSHHGNPATNADDYLVHTEFGADVWTYILQAGFSELTMCTFAYPAGISFVARKEYQD